MKIDIKEFERKLHINDENITEELQEQQANFFFVTNALAQVETEYDAIKLEVEKLRSLLDKKIRFEAKENKMKITEGGIEAEINLKPEYQAAVKKLLDARFKKKYWKALKEAWAGRKDTLIQIAITKRQEMESMMSDKVIKRGVY